MSWAPLLLLLCALCAGSLAQLSLSQPPSQSVSPGQTAKLTCTSSGISFSKSYVYWYQQKPGTAPKCVIYKDTERPSDIPERFSGSVNVSTNTAYLTIAGALAEDQAQYYCKSANGSTSEGNFQYIFGGGTQLNVLTGETKLPALNVFPPSSEEVATGKATLVCTMHDFYPGSVTVTWKADGTTISSGVETTRPSKQSDNNLFMASSILSVPAVDWSGGRKYTCECTHQSKVIEKSVKHSECV